MQSMHKLLMHCVTATVAASLSIPATSQEPAAQAPPVIKSQVNLVNIFATVRDKKKHIMPSLKKEDFHVFEGDLLLLVVFEDMKVFLLQAGHDVFFLVADGGENVYEVHLALDHRRCFRRRA